MEVNGFISFQTVLANWNRGSHSTYRFQPPVFLKGLRLYVGTGGIRFEVYGCQNSTGKNRMSVYVVHYIGEYWPYIQIYKFLCSFV